MWSLARAGDPATSFRPASWGKGVIIAPSTFFRTNGDVAIFNYSPEKRTFKASLAEETSLDASKTMACTDVWENMTVPVGADGDLEITLPGGTTALLACRNV